LGDGSGSRSADDAAIVVAPREIVGRRGGRYSRGSEIVGRLCLIKSALRDRFVRTEIPLALEVFLGQRQLGVGGREIGLRLLPVDEEGVPIHLRQRGAGGDPVANLHQNTVHLAGDLGGNGDGVECADLAHQLHRRSFFTDLGPDELNLARCECPFEGLGGGGGIIIVRTVAT
jgi:hypothetical protein